MDQSELIALGKSLADLEDDLESVRNYYNDQEKEFCRAVAGFILENRLLSGRWELAGLSQYFDPNHAAVGLTIQRGILKKLDAILPLGQRLHILVGEGDSDRYVGLWAGYHDHHSLNFHRISMLVEFAPQQGITISHDLAEVREHVAWERETLEKKEEFLRWLEGNQGGK